VIVGRSARDLAFLAVTIVLVGAVLFGLWHVVVGGFVHGNPRAATFGIALTLLAGGLLGATAAVGRRFGRA
jgi:hypothetical protein